MGKNTNPSTHLSGSVVPSRAGTPRPRNIPCPPMAPTKIACPPAVDPASSTRPPSPSPLTSSLSFEPVVTCFDTSAVLPSSLPQSPVDEDVFYDALEDLPGIDEPHPHKPVLTQVLQAPPDPEFDGAAKGRTSIQPRGGRTSAPRPAYNPLPTPQYSPITPVAPGFPVVRGSSKPTVSHGAHPSGVPLAVQAQLNFARQRVPESIIPRREPTKKALLVGINYSDMGKDRRLWYAVGDATRFGHSLKNLGFNQGNIKLITDESGFETPTYTVLMQSIDWLVRGATEGDVLFFVFSGHCVKDQGLLTSDKRFISRADLHRQLVMRIPTGCELQIVFDCCSAAAMIQLQYCVGRMGPPQECQQPEKTATCESEAAPLKAAEQWTQPPCESLHIDPLQGSFRGLPSVAPPSPASPTSPGSPAPITPPVLAPVPVPAPVAEPAPQPEAFAPVPAKPSSHRRGGVVAAPPVPTPVPAMGGVAAAVGAVAGQATEYVSSWFGLGQAALASAAPTRPSTPAAVPTRAGTPAPARACAGGDPRRGRQVVVEADRTPDHFEERNGDFVRPAGRVMVWAGTGETQQAFEAYGGVKHGIVTHALCSALDACANPTNTLNRRDCWRYLVDAIHKENTHRSERDAQKSPENRPSQPRAQHAELWVSQAEPLSSAAPVLDQPMVMPFSRPAVPVLVPPL